VHRQQSRGTAEGGRGWADLRKLRIGARPVLAEHALVRVARLARGPTTVVMRLRGPQEPAPRRSAGRPAAAARGARPGLPTFCSCTLSPSQSCP